MSLFRTMLLLAVGAAMAATANAGVFYKYYDKSGNLVITDTPREGAEKVETKPVMIIPFPKGKAGADAQADQKKKISKASDYVIVIQSPASETSYQRSGDPIPVAVSISPALLPGHRMEMLLDGARMGDATSVIKTDTLERGAHQFQVRVLDGNDRIVKDATVPFFIQQPSAMAPKPKTK